MHKQINKNKKQRKKSESFQKLDQAIISWMQRYGLKTLRISLGFIFLWFGALKFFPNLSPAEALAIDTISIITFGLLSGITISIALAIWEVLIGIGLLTGKWMRFTLLLLYLQLPGTFMPVFLFPDLVFEVIPFVPTLEGQYIFKNLVLVGAGILMGGFVEKKTTGGLKEMRKGE